MEKTRDTSREHEDHEKIMENLRARRLRRHSLRTGNLVQVRKIIKILEEREGRHKTYP